MDLILRELDIHKLDDNTLPSAEDIHELSPIRLQIPGNWGDILYLLVFTVGAQ